MMDELEDLQRNLKSKCSVFINYQLSRHEWRAGVETERNVYPYWIAYNDKTLEGAVKQLIGFFEGRVADHADRPRTAKDFLQGS